MDAHALAGIDADHVAGVGIVIEHVVGGTTGTEMVGERLVGMADGDLAQLRIAAVIGRPHQEFEVHHVVDDHGVFVVAVIPRFDDASCGPEACNE